MNTEIQQRLSDSSLGKLPPQAPDMEEAVLGGLMLEKDVFIEVSTILRPESFYKEAHQKIYQAIQALFNESKPVDILTVTAQLRKQGELEIVGGAYYITELTNRVASAANIEYHARIIEQKFLQREMIRISRSVINDAYEDTTDVFELMDDTEQALFNISQQRGSDFTDISESVARRLNAYETKPENGLTGIGTGLDILDKKTHGWQASDLIILAARPAMGKTALAMQVAKDAAIKHGKAVGIFSLEMSTDQLTDRLISSETDIFLNKLRTSDIEQWEWQSMHHKISNLVNANIFIDDTPGLGVFEFRAKARRLKAKHDIQLIVVDYLQLMNGKGDSRGGNREQEISTISRTLKIVAKELNVPVIALSQLSRAVETRGGDKRPHLADLRESGSIEQDADMVVFLYRPEYYGFDQDENGIPYQKGHTEFIIAKHRNGVCETVDIQFNGALMKFTELHEASGFEKPAGFTIHPDKFTTPQSEYDWNG